MELASILVTLTIGFAIAIRVLLAHRLEITLKPLELSLKAE